MRIRYRAGVVGESKRVVHAAELVSEGLIRTLCGVEMDPALVEPIGIGGMPCMQCIARVALVSRCELPSGERDPAETPAAWR